MQSRLSLSQGPVLGTTTPYNLGWLKTEIYDPWKEGDSDIEVVRFESTVNPAFPQAEFDRMERKMQAHRFGMRYRGEFTRPAGLIYGCFDDAMLCDPFPIPADWTRTIGVDFGAANTAILWLAEDPATSVWYVYDESLEGDKTSRQHAQGAIAKLKEISGEDSIDALDYSAVGGGPSETQSRLDWSDGGLLVDKPTLGGVEEGIDRGTELIQGKRLRVFRTCRRFRDEIGRYKRKTLDDGTVLDAIVNKNQFHILDAFRYAAVKIVEGGGMFIY